MVGMGERQTESKESNILIEGAIMGLAKNVALGKFLGIHSVFSYEFIRIVHQAQHHDKTQTL